MKTLVPALLTASPLGTCITVPPPANLSVPKSTNIETGTESVVHVDQAIPGVPQKGRWLQAAGGPGANPFFGTKMPNWATEIKP